MVGSAGTQVGRGDKELRTRAASGAQPAERPSYGAKTQLPGQPAGPMQGQPELIHRSKCRHEVAGSLVRLPWQGELLGSGAPESGGEEAIHALHDGVLAEAVARKRA